MREKIFIVEKSALRIVPIAGNEASETKNKNNMNDPIIVTDDMKTNALSLFKGCTVATVKSDLKIAKSFPDADSRYVATLEWLIDTAKKPWNTLKK